jgi:hypothetical protein
VLETDIKYRFEVSPVGDIPSGGYFTLYIPGEIGLPRDPATGLDFKCLTGCVETGYLTWIEATRILTFNSVFPDTRDYLFGGT